MRILILTHGGLFHADEVCAVALVRMFCDEVVVQRVTETEVFKSFSRDFDKILVVDIGLRHNANPSEKVWWLDHHQNPSIPCAASLTAQVIPYLFHDKVDVTIWTKFLERWLPGVDAADRATGRSAPWGTTTLSHLIAAGNNDDIGDNEKAFEDSIGLALSLLRRLYADTQREIISEPAALSAVSRYGGQPVVVLEEGLRGVAKYFSDTATLFVVFPSVRGGWILQCVPPTENPKGMKRSIPADRNFKGLNFLHPRLYMASFTSREEAVDAATTLTQP